MTTAGTTLRPTLVGWGYVLGVAVLATVGFATESTAVILLAAVVALPASVVGVPVFYLVFGLLALVPGANPSSGTGSSSCTASGDCTYSSTGDPAAWFLLTTDVVGVLALTAAALLNVVALRFLRRAGRRATA